MRRAWIADWAVAAGVAAVLLVAGATADPVAGVLDPLGYALLAASGLALGARRTVPIPVLIGTGLCALGYQAAGFDVPAVAFLVAVYAAVRAGHRVVTVIASVALLAALPLAALTTLHDTGAAFAQARGALEIAWLIAAGAAGEALRQAERRAEEAERTREELARRRADEERLHIARELHDSLTHQISVIKVQSEAAVHVARKRGEEVPAALLAIRDAGREAARELRATLEALRDDGERPPHGLADVPGPGRDTDRPRRGGQRARRRRTHRVPRRPGSADQHHPARRGPLRRGVDRAPPRLSGGAGGGRRLRHPRRRARTGGGPARHAGTGHRARWAAPGGAARPGWLLCPCRAARGGCPVIRVLLVDDQPLIRSGFRALLELEDDIEVVAEAGDGAEGIALAARHLPDIALIDIRMPVLDGIETTRRIAADPALAGVHVVVLTNYGMDEYVFHALRAGAAGFLVKDIRPEDFLHAVRVAARGDALLAPSITRRLIDRFVTEPLAADVETAGLTTREREAVVLAARGLSNDEIAERMVISPLTAKTHINRAMTKLHARDRAQLVIRAYESGLVAPRCR
ncbi:Response regulator protein vraR [Nocardia farcinica]|uniref:Response regulator protein vraR n=1 Tax=Nocardia farcinica TaxID=37329 RepID=A0A449GDX2_NOCFR|nr:Response regulator protein vraR [Nocardia farcinica]